MFLDLSGNSKPPRHITWHSRHLEEDECSWDALGIPETLYETTLSELSLGNRLMNKHQVECH
jgi:hypothetical protein